MRLNDLDEARVSRHVMGAGRMNLVRSPGFVFLDHGTKASIRIAALPPLQQLLQLYPEWRVLLRTGGHDGGPSPWDPQRAAKLQVLIQQ